jgi:Fe-S-cluster-containing dehydrogenase component/CRP-like cAMP-binding protein
MAADILGIPRPQRWDIPFGPEMTDAAVEHILKHPPFNRIGASRFPSSLPLPGILRNDARLRRHQPGDIITRAGDYLGSAFFILSGACRIELAGALPDKLLGRRPSQRKTWSELIAQLWPHRWPEVRDPATYTLDQRVAQRQSGRTKSIYLADVQAVLANNRTAQIGPGQSFGETTALSRTPRTFSVFAETETELVEVRWQGLRDLMRRDEALRKHAEQTFREQALKEFLATSPLFQHLPAADMDKVLEQAAFDSYGSYDRISNFRDVPVGDFAARLEKEPIIAAEGDYVNGLIMVRNGVVRVSKKCDNGQRTVGYLIAGQNYGFDEISASARDGTMPQMSYSLRAVGYVNVVLLPTVTIEKYVLKTSPHPKVPLSVVPVPKETPRFDPSTGVKTELLEFLVENRFIAGTAAMVIDLDRCTRCDDCVRACAGAHDNNPRFLRQGPSYGQYMVANACMHCQDPVCMIECPTGAIHRDLTGGMVVINDATCIGCGACSRNCPYDAIRMVEIRDARGDFLVDQNSNLPIAKATKCDLCVDQHGGPACQRACPHDALKRVDMRDLSTFAQWLNR